MNPQTQAWPDGVIARYLTVGGATVDITETGPRDSRELHSTVATCSGCKENYEWDWPYGFYDYRNQYHPLAREEAIQQAKGIVSDWAQKHAEVCRAMPRP